MTIAYSQKDSASLAYIRQVSWAAVINNAVTWKEIDEFDQDVLLNKKGIEGLSSVSKAFINKIENYINVLQEKAC